MTPTQEWIAAHIDNLMKDLFYGKLTIHFQKGNLDWVTKEESLRPPKDEANTGRRRPGD